jgi:hypothetical protein
MIGFYVWFVSSVTFWHGGWQVGPRYLAVMLPFLTLAAAVGFRWFWHRGLLWVAVAALVVVSMAVYVPTAATFPHFPKSFVNPLFGLVGYLLDRGYVAHNFGQYFLGLSQSAGLLPYFFLAAALAVYAACGPATFGRWNGASPRRLLYGTLAVCAAVFVLHGYRQLKRTRFEKCCAWITRKWEAERRATGTAPLASQRRRRLRRRGHRVFSDSGRR